jgi:hypothetical protein
MNDLEVIKPHIERYAATKTWRMNHQEKLALKRVYKDNGHGVLNTSCGNCISKALKVLGSGTIVSFSDEPDRVNNLQDMKMPQLRELAKSMGVKVAVKKVDLINNILNDVKA